MSPKEMNQKASKGPSDEIIEELLFGNIRELLQLPILIFEKKPNLEVLLERAKARNAEGKLKYVLWVTGKLLKEYEIEPLLQKEIEQIAGTPIKEQGLPTISEFQQIFELEQQLSQKSLKMSLTEQIRISSERDTYLALSTLFPRKQREIIEKKLAGQKLTKTEQEYYSRVIKKKLQAIQDLQALSRALLRM